MLFCAPEICLQTIHAFSGSSGEEKDDYDMWTMMLAYYEQYSSQMFKVKRRLENLR